MQGWVLMLLDVGVLELSLFSLRKNIHHGPSCWAGGQLSYSLFIGINVTSCLDVRQNPVLHRAAGSAQGKLRFLTQLPRGRMLTAAPGLAFEP